METFSNIQYLLSGRISNYHSMQLRLERSISNGQSSLVAYTWGKALASSPEHSATSAAGNGIDVGVTTSHRPNKLLLATAHSKP